ncbi:iron ABC transporter substrate-binding protein [Corynebacterium renale]|uniref:Iron complex transport system substrate-binding protein n=1 Tax=Corynebacterium renale TaxID=1724 RepID=A0A2A9DMR4_9CORY|nr:ABC transporter substrate-binding protein [Corynebacterium renale]PFG28037.1 iron complex transport system substrate-binding protein [Corynebacterium renale]SQG65376.1 iron ABC transporter substrate-binding protein [Corynebacterium renale]SQI21196.1 iron ABC transporter substrate-binding protein [Corynebacterium renale]STC99061.1 iron ABC transporter substrate-binding protein [Corynebacterium renale]
MRLRGTMRIIGACAVSSTLVLTGCSSSSENEATPSSSKSASGALEITDVAGRTVTLDHAPERVILGESRSIFATSILDKDNPLDKVVGIGTDLQSSVGDYWERFKPLQPKVTEIPEIGSIKKGDVTVENLVAQKPDVVIISGDQYKAAQSGGLTDSMDAAGIKYVVTDFRAKPLENTTVSMEVFGKVFGKEAKAKEFNDTWTKTVNDIQKRTANASTKPKTFVWRAAGLKDCCSTWNDSNISELVNAAGGENVGDMFVQGESGDLTPEQVIEAQPDQIIVTGGQWGNKKGKDGKTPMFAAMGYGVDAAASEASLGELVTHQPGFELLNAPKDGNLHAIWHQFYNSPLNYIAMAQIAQWLHPEEFADLDVEALWKDAHDKWVPIEPDGSFFATYTK